MSKLSRLRDNIAAIKAVLVGGENDREALQLFTGFGGLGFVLNPLDTAAWSKSDMDCFVDTIMLHQLLRDNSKSEQEYQDWMQSIKESTLTAYYTPDWFVGAIAKAIFKGGDAKFRRLLDPAAGARGQFITAFEHYTMEAYGIGLQTVAYEKDLLSGMMLKAVKRAYWQDIRIAGFETIPAKELGTYDLVSTNVPFGDVRVYDPAYTKSKSEVRRAAAKMIHRYYVLKGLDCLRQGGVLAYIITSNYLNRDTEQLREALKQARLVGAYRLANNLFKENGTEVGTDLLVMQKDERRGELSDEECLLLTAYEDQGCPTNMYFTCYPDHIVATNEMVGTDAYGKPGFVYQHKDGVAGIAKQLGEVLSKDVAEKVKVSDGDGGGAGRGMTGNGTATEGSGEKKPAKKRESGKERLLKGLLEEYTALYEQEQNEQTEQTEKRECVNRLYNYFVQEYGFLHDQKNVKTVERVAKDLLGIEIKDADGKWVKADIMLRPVAFSTAEPSSTLTAQEALAAVLNEFGWVNILKMEQLTGKDEKELAEELQGELFYNPKEAKFEIKARFISGNVIEKLEWLKAAKEKIIKFRSPLLEYMPYIDDAIAALEAAIPTPIPFEQLDFNLGERWVDANIYGRFASEFFEMPADPKYPYRGGRPTVTVNYQPTIDQYAVSCSMKNQKIWSQYGVSSEASKTLDGIDLLTHALHNTYPEMMRYKRDAQGRKEMNDKGDYIKVRDADKTQSAHTKIDEIREGYCEWLRRQPKELRDRLADVYNRRFNCYVKPRYDGSHQTFPDVDWAGLERKYNIPQPVYDPATRKKVSGGLYGSQEDCVWMLKLLGGGICDHEVGSGKTLIMCVAAHEMKRIGLCHKPMIIGLKANVGAIAETYRTAYPKARVLFATEQDYCRANREAFFNQMKNNDWDCVIMSHDQFGMIPQSDRVQRDILRDEIRQLDEALQLLERQGDYTITAKQRRGLEQRKRNRWAKLEALIDTINNRTDDVVDFEQMGIDHIFIDESHQFKNLGFTTRHGRVAGLGNSEGSQRAFNLLIAIRTIQERTGRDLGATFLSGTTVTNSLTELYSLFRYLRPKALEAQDIRCFDAWAAIFTKKTSEFEFSITNQIVMKERFRYFIKVPELAMFYNEITDYRTAEDVGIERPEKNMQLFNIKPTADQRDYIQTLMRFAQTGDFSLIGIPNPTKEQQMAKMLYATDNARKMSLDMRLIDPQYGDDPGNKASQCAKKVAEYYRRYDSVKGTQLIFSDLSAWKKNEWNIYDEIKRKLTQDYGIPSDEVRFIQECKGERAKQKMIDDTNAGRVRVLFGSTTMLGTGVNAQQRIVAVHHLDTPWRPSDLEQRDGRAIRKGNLIARDYAGNQVDIIIYAVEQSLDSYKFNLLHCKQTFISQLKRGQLSIRTLDEGAIDEKTGMNFAEYMAVLSGNTDLLERAKMERKIAGLEAERKQFYADLQQQRDDRQRMEQDAERLERNISDARADQARFEQARRLNEDGTVYNDITINGCSVPDGITVGTDDYAKAIGTEMLRLDRELQTNGQYQSVGTVYGFELLVHTVSVGTLMGEPQYENRWHVKAGRILWNHNEGRLNHTSARLSAECPLLALQRIPQVIAGWEARLESTRTAIQQLAAIADRTWGKDTQLTRLKTDLAALDRKIERDLHEADKPAEPAPLRQAA